MLSENRIAHMDRKDFLKLGGTSLAGAILLGTAGRVSAKTESSLKGEFQSAARRYKVPVELLLAMGYVNTMWEMPSPDTVEYEERDTQHRGDYGVMALTQNPFEDDLGHAASLTKLPEDRLKSDRAANIMGGAALLADIQGQNRPSDINGWQEAVAEYVGNDYYATQVYAWLKSGAQQETSKGESVELAAQKDAEEPQVYTAQSYGSDYPRAYWRPANSNNYTASKRESSANIYRIVVHVVQGSAGSAISYFQDPGAYVSAHFVVGRKGGVVQCVHRKDIAYHAGHWKTNVHSIGIEHEGYIGNKNSFTRRMYRASARLTAFCCKKHRIPVDRKHIIGHNQVPGCPGPGGGANCHTDPGKYWNWKRYMRLVRYYRKRV